MPGCGSQHPLRSRLRLAGRGPNSDSLFPPLAAVVAVAPKGRAFWIHLYYILPYFPPCHKAKWPENSQNGQKSRKNAW